MTSNRPKFLTLEAVDRYYSSRLIALDKQIETVVAPYMKERTELIDEWDKQEERFTPNTVKQP